VIELELRTLVRLGRQQEVRRLRGKLTSSITMFVRMMCITR